ncbi:MAG TPA: BON domain-containing protein [Blastocatellia bacterium]|nr:BON domain-containing protein [Blastocatellia bacterium]
MSTFKGKVLALIATLAIGASVAVAAPASSPQDDARTANKVRKELVTLPYYGMFDNLAYKVEGGTVTLYGQVVDAVTRKDAENRVKRIEGVERVINNIQVLPVSGFDNTIRVRTYRAIARQGGLYRYFMGANPSIHIIVNRGRVTLEGVVSNRMDSQLAYMAARQVPGVFEVTNNLRVENER